MSIVINRILLRKIQYLNPHLDSHHLDWSNQEEEEEEEKKKKKKEEDISV